MNEMQTNRYHTFYVKNLPTSHPLRQLYKDPYDTDNINEYKTWKTTREKHYDKFPTNTHIRFANIAE